MKNQKIHPVWYDLIDDFDLIVSSFQEQYGIRLSKELSTMSGAEFFTLLKGISPSTILGRIVSIRAEDDKETMKSWGKEEYRIYNEWRRKTAKKVSKEEADRAIETFKQAFITMAGKE